MPPLSVLIVDDEAPARALLREYLAGLAGPGGGRVRQRFRGRGGGRGACTGPALPRHPDAGARRLRSARAAGPQGRRGLRHRLRRVRDPRLRGARGRLSAQALRPPRRLAEALARPPPAAARASRRRSRSSPPRRRTQRSPLSAHRVRAKATSTSCRSRIDYVEAQDDYGRLRSRPEARRAAQPLAELEALLDPARFVRVHRSYIVNLDGLAPLELYAKDSRVAVLADGTKLPVSRAGYARVRGRGSLPSHLLTGGEH